jgi:hypothetical protein
MRSRQRSRAQQARPRRTGASTGATAAAVLTLQRGAGNAAVARLVRDSRRAILRQPTSHTFEFGKDVAVDFAAKAKELAKDGTVTAAELPALQAVALKDETVGDAERMFMAGLLEPANAAALAAAEVKKGKSVTFSFASSKTGANLRTAADVGRQKPAAGDREAALKQINALVGKGNEDKVRALVKFGPHGTQTGPQGVLKAMLASASDSTPADMLAAAMVYVTAASAKHPLTADLRAGNIKVDAVSKAPPRGGHPSEAVYSTHGTGGREKGDTLYLKPSIDIANVYHRSLVIHELEHAAHDKAVANTGLASEELGAYQVQMKYALDQIAAGDSKGIAKVAAEWNMGLMCGAVLASTGSTALKDIVRKIHKASRVKGKPEDRFLELMFRDANIDENALDLVADELGITRADQTAFEGLKGETLLQAGKVP